LTPKYIDEMKSKKLKAKSGMLNVKSREEKIGKREGIESK